MPSKAFVNESWNWKPGAVGQRYNESTGSGELSVVYEAIRGAISGLDPNGPHELDLRMSRTMLPSGFLFLRGLPSLSVRVSGMTPLGDRHKEGIPHRRGVITADAHVAAALASRPNLIALDLRTGTGITRSPHLPCFGLSVRSQRDCGT